MAVKVNNLSGGYKNSYDETWKFPVNLKRGDLYSLTERSDGLWYGVIDIHKDKDSGLVKIIAVPVSDPLTLGPRLETSSPIFVELSPFVMIKTLTNGRSTPIDGGVVYRLN